MTTAPPDERPAILFVDDEDQGSPLVSGYSSDEGCVPEDQQ